MLPVFKPSITQKEIDAVTRVLRSGWLGQGPEVEKFEKEFAKWLGRKYAVAMSSCTAALHVAVKLLRAEAAFTTPITFVSTNLALLYEGVQPLFIDIEEDTLNIDADILAKEANKCAGDLIMVVHYGGHACDMEVISEVAAYNNMYIIEDCAHAIGGHYNGQRLGTFGNIACFSFHAVKNLTCGEGGMLVTDDAEWAERARQLRWCGISKGTYDRAKARTGYEWEYDITELGFKYTMSDINAAVGRVQLKRLEQMQKKRHKLAAIYDTHLNELAPNVIPLATRDYATRAYHNYVVWCVNRNGLKEYLKENGIASSVHYYPNNLFDILKSPIWLHQTPTAFKVWKSILTLPMYPDLKEKEAHYICDKVKEFYDA